MENCHVVGREIDMKYAVKHRLVFLAVNFTFQHSHSYMIVYNKKNFWENNQNTESTLFFASGMSTLVDEVRIMCSSRPSV